MVTEEKTAKREYITIKTALEAVTFALEEGLRIGVPVSVFVVGPTLESIAFASADNATQHSKETCRRKAQTAASTRRATGWMPAGLAVELPLATGSLLTNIPGGVPIKFNGVVVAGLGIAGGTVEQDAQLAAAVLTAIGSDPS